jgi:hypothetical protein
LSKEADILKAALTPQVLGLFWITSTNLSQFPSPFLEMDYFLDGLLTRYIQQRQNRKKQTLEEKNFFVSESFGTPFFVAHLKDHESVLKELEELMELIKPLAREGKRKILLLDKNHNHLAALEKDYRDWIFEHLEL